MKGQSSCTSQPGDLTRLNHFSDVRRWLRDEERWNEWQNLDVPSPKFGTYWSFRNPATLVDMDNILSYCFLMAFNGFCWISKLSTINSNCLCAIAVKQSSEMSTFWWHSSGAMGTGPQSRPDRAWRQWPRKGGSAVFFWQMNNLSFQRFNHPIRTLYIHSFTL